MGNIPHSTFVWELIVFFCKDCYYLYIMLSKGNFVWETLPTQHLPEKLLLQWLSLLIYHVKLYRTVILYGDLYPLYICMRNYFCGDCHFLYIMWSYIEQWYCMGTFTHSTSVWEITFAVIFTSYISWEAICIEQWYYMGNFLHSTSVREKDKWFLQGLSQLV